MGKKVAFGAGVILLLAAVGITAGMAARSHSYKAPAGTWNSNAIAGSFAAIHVLESDPSNVSIVLLYDLDNRSGADYTLSSGPGLIVMGRLKSTGSLSPEGQYHLQSAVFLPAGNRTRITLETTLPFRWPGQMDTAAEAQFRQMVNRAVADLGGFVLFDPATHYQIELPGGWPPQAETASMVTN
jgi:hypothetical protein